MFGNKEKKDNLAKKEWRDGVYLCTVKSSLEADILESKLRGEGIPSERRYKGAGNFLEITLGANSTFPIDLYVPELALEDAQNIIVAIPLLSADGAEENAVDFDELSEEELKELIGEPEDE